MMEIQHFSRHKAKASNQKCEFCSKTFQTAADKNSHILTHFSKENCIKCDQNLIRIGENLYVLHSTITCIETKSKRKRKRKSKEPIKSSNTDQNVDETIEAIEFSACNEQSGGNSEVFEVKPIKEESINSLIEPEAVDVNVIEEFKEEVDMKNTQKFQNQKISHETIVPLSKNIEKPVEKIVDAPQNRSKETKSETCTKKPKRNKRNKCNDIILKCEYKGCDKFIRKQNQRQHMATHTNERFECDICHSSLASKNGLRAHFYLHYPKKELNCTICGSTYRSLSSLSQHVRFVHNKEPKRFICNICGRALRKSHLLKEHMNKHTGEKPFDCPHEGCEKRFFTKTHRSEHIRSHTGEKPYKCSEEGCDRQFAYAIDFKRHKFKAHGIYINKFPCPVCSKIFPENMLLKKHLKSHEMHDS